MGQQLQGLACQAVSDGVPYAPTKVVIGTDYVSPISCGPRRKAFEDLLKTGVDDCFNAMAYCPLAFGAKADPKLEVVIYRVYNVGNQALVRTDIACDVPVGSAIPTIAAIKDEVTKRAPKSDAGVGGTDFIINVAVVFYALTDPDANIPAFPLGGRSLTAKLHVTKTVWNWGDGTTSTFDSVGRKYEDEVPCESLTVCSSYIAHSFSTPGFRRVSVEVHWDATVSIDGGPQIAVPGEIISPAGATAPVAMRQAHSVLVAPS
jgi:hypothetical protein